MEKEALMIVDFTHAFADKEIDELYVAGWETLVPVINTLIREVKGRGGIIIASKEEHDRWSISFASNFRWKMPITRVWPDDPRAWVTLEEVLSWKSISDGTLPSAWFTLDELITYLRSLGGKMQVWPDHSIRNEKGSEFFEGLDIDQIDHIVVKWRSNIDHPYSSFSAVEDSTGRTSEEICDDEGVEKIKFVWLATDYCAWESNFDFATTGKYQTELILPWCRAVSLDTEALMIEKLRQVGALIS
jgi:nicotinamidase-related amidase